ncbi:MAG: glycosyltransferase family 39 protein [Verrucomicrobia bacterium]|nr:glycosyltransferase family 39 protein [Verrucomicrobiota bacterium]
MDSPRSFLKRVNLRAITPEIAVPVAAFVVLVVLIIRNCGLHASVFDDEWIYSKFSRLAPMAQAPVPSYLFFRLFGFTRYAGKSFLEAARIFNACFFAMAMVFIYLICRRVTSWPIALFVALISVLGPISAYSAFFMPESMYFCAYWAFTWLVLRSINGNPWVLGIGSGLILGAMAGIKFHAIFLLTGLAAFLLLCCLSKFISIKSAIVSCLCAVCVFLLIRFGLSYHYAGLAGLSFTGTRYGGAAATPLAGFKALDLLQTAGQLLIGHSLALSFLLSVPLAATVSFTTDPQDRAQRILQLYAVAFLTPLLLISPLSTALFAGGSPYDTIQRLHLRYYNFALPVFFVIAAAQANASFRPIAVSPKACLAALVVAAATLYGILIGLRKYAPNFVDSPELTLVYYPANFAALGALSVGVVVIWAINKSLGGILYLFAFLPPTFISTVRWIDTQLRYRIVASTYDEAGQFARELLGTQASKLVIVASDLLSLNKALFSVDNPDASILDIPQDAALEPAQIPTGKTWILLIGNHQYSFPARYKLSIGAYSLINIGNDSFVDFRNGAWPGVITRIVGLAGRESFGQWSIGDAVRMEFVSPLPKKVKVTLAAHAFGPNAELPFTLVAGSTEQQFRVGTETTEVSLMFDSSGSDRSLIIKIPKPTSPRELWGLPDDRRLGIALEHLSITDLSKS